MPDKLSVVVPVFNSERSLPELVRRLQSVLQPAAESFELILVNDGSTDGSWNVIQSLSRQHAWIKPIGLARNYGQHNALLCGLRAAQYPLTVTLDDDLQNPPEELPKLLAALREDIDVVYGTAEQEYYRWPRGPVTRLVKWALSVAMGGVARDISAFRVLRTSLRDHFAQFDNPYVSVDVLLAWSSRAFTTVTVRHAEREHGHSQYSIRKLLAYTVNVLFGFSTLPLRLATLVGLSLAAFGGFVLVFVLVRYFIQHASVPGFPFLASVIAIFSGAQLCALGILGEYVARIYMKTLQRPAYVMKSPVSSPHAP